MNKTRMTTLIGAAVASTLAGSAQASENPFALKELASGYVQLAEAGKDGKEMVCGEGKCGGAKMNSGSMNCGAMMQKAPAEPQKAMEGKCAGMNMGGQAPAAPAAPAAPQQAK